MKKIFLISLVCIVSKISCGQVSGNINYQRQVRYSNDNFELDIPSNSKLTIVVKGLANLTADNYVAIFSVAQTGKTTEEVNNLIDNRINEALKNIKTKQGVETYVDMISFVPVYEYEVEKKLFNKKTYNEIPKGFEVKKNIHIKYKDPNLLNEIIATLANSEIYDLVRVDYISDKIEATKADLVNRAKLLLQEKIKGYKQIIGSRIDSSEKNLVDGFKIMYPVEMYNSYQAYSNSDLDLKKTANSNQVEKSTTLYYQPVVNKDFDLVLNPTILEPAIQITYEIKLEVDMEKDIKNDLKEYFIITPNGDLKKISPRN
ncbi:SIMPL domain-containing protein [Ferruginibacter albus]|uniref:SIMPL domain-containing protein n=1 Tax=Ferruginibacter albus TaxID=2875540 RepID=UPI001CC7155F|nr:SIMPL domain-containing protein [Ferruginibacter albus]UAY52180.1 SIMPL domain-containing protein [Ferruginibacter albus]